MFWPHLRLSDKTRQIIKTIVTYAVVFIAYSYLIYQLCTTDYSSLLHTLYVRITSNPSVLLYLALIMVLMPVNIALEAAKWRHLLRAVYPMSFSEAQRQVYYGFIGGFITPYRAGDYPSRVLLMKSSEHWAKAISLGVLGSVVLTIAILLSGAIPFYVYMMGGEPRPFYCLLCLLPFLLTLLRPILKKFGWKQRFLSDDVATIYMLSLARYVVFCIQLYFMLRFVGLSLTVTDALSRIPYYYLLVTVTPNIPISDPAIRGSWAVIAFGPLGAIAALGLWFVNTIIPLLIGGVIGFNFKNTH